jgi:thiol-disulfide isomerase/thioredoxin
MRHAALWGVLVSAALLPAQDHAIVAQPKGDAGAARLDAALRQALGALAKAGAYAVEVESQWGTAAGPSAELAAGAAPQGSSRYRLVSHGRHYRVEVQSQGAASPDLIAVNDGAQVITYYPARKLYAQHPADSREADVSANTMLAMSLAGSALDILLARDVAAVFHAQAAAPHDHGDVLLDGLKSHCFEVLWAGAKVELWFAAEGDPLLVQFRRTASVPTGVDKKYEMVCTARFHWQLGAQPPAGTFALALPADARRVKEIYDALAGEETHTLVGKPLPKLSLAKLDGSEIPLAAAADAKATVLIFWATWCTPSVEDLPAVTQFVAAYQGRGVRFYAVNVGEPPGAVRRFTAKSPLVSTVLLDPRSQLASALRVRELPAVAIVGPDNTVRAILHGTAKELQGELASQLQTLLAAPASKTARRPDESQQAK